MKKNKKAAVSEGITDLAAYLFFILIMILFFFLFKLIPEEINADIDDTVGTANANNIMLNYLRYEVDVDLGSGIQKLSMADLFALYYDGKNSDKGKFQKIIGDNTEEFFKNYKNLRWSVFLPDILDESRSDFGIREGETEYSKNEESMIKKVESVCAVVPAHSNREFKVQLLLSNLKMFTESGFGSGNVRTEYQKLRDNHEFDC